MSSQNATLDQDWAARARQQTAPEVHEVDTESLRKEVLQGGARYGKSSGRTTKESTGPTRVCLTCDAEIPHDVARVVGDDDGCVPVCGDCDDRCRNTVPAVENYYSGGSR